MQQLTNSNDNINLFNYINYFQRKDNDKGYLGEDKGCGTKGPVSNSQIGKLC